MAEKAGGGFAKSFWGGWESFFVCVMEPQARPSPRNTLFVVLLSTFLGILLFETFSSVFQPASLPTSSAAGFAAGSRPSNGGGGMTTTSTTHDAELGGGHLLIYNRAPGGAGSGAVAAAMNEAYVAHGRRAAHCFKHASYNEMSLRTVINRDRVDLYACSIKLTKQRYRDLMTFRGGNVTLMTSTTSATNAMVGAYLAQALATNNASVESVTDDEGIANHVRLYKRFMEESYDIGEVYNFHGAGEEFTLHSCPTEYEHLAALQRIAARYEIIVDLDKPEESAALVEIVTGVRPDFTTRTTTSPLVMALAQVDVPDHRGCALQLVHRLLTLQFNLIKDRLLQNRCFDEHKGSFHLCDFMPLRKENVTDRTRQQSFDLKDMLSENFKRSLTN